MEINIYSYDLVVKLFYIIDNLCVELLPKKLGHASKKGRHPSLCISELITIAVIFSITDVNAFKTFYRIFSLTNCFPNLPEYSRLLRNIKEVTVFTMIILQILMRLNRSSCSDNEVKLIDSFPIPVCSNKRIFGYSVSELANRGKSSMGWFYGFKIHLLISEKGSILNVRITAGNVSDKDHDLVTSILRDIRGVLIGDAGYLSEPLREKLLKQGIYLLTGVKRNMKKLMTQAQHKLLKLRQLIEVVNGQIKYRKGLVSSLPRSDAGYFFRYITAIFAHVVMTSFF